MILLLVRYYKVPREQEPKYEVRVSLEHLTKDTTDVLKVHVSGNQL